MLSMKNIRVDAEYAENDFPKQTNMKKAGI